jgi:hypothetical protein
MTRFLLVSGSCGFVYKGRSLWREDGSVVYNCCWRSPAQSLPGPSPVGLATIFYCLRFETSLFIASYGSQVYDGGIQPRLHTGYYIQKWKPKLCYDRRSVGQSVLVSSTHLGLTTRFLLLSDSCRFVDVGDFLWRENGSAVCNCCWFSPAQSFLGQSPAGLVTIFCCLRFETRPAWRVRSSYLYSPGAGCLSYTPRLWVFFRSVCDSQGYGEGIWTRLHAGWGAEQLRLRY